LDSARLIHDIRSLLASPFFGWSALQPFEQSSLNFRSFASCRVDKGNYVLVHAGELPTLYLRFYKLAKIIWEFQWNCRHLARLH
jgi:hypothetical protein